MSVLSTPARHAFEDEALVEAQRAEPSMPRTSDCAYRGSTTVARGLHTIGWLGLVGVWPLRARKRRE